VRRFGFCFRLKQYRQRDVEPRDDAFAFKLVTELKYAHPRRRVVDVDLASTRIDDPDLLYARLKILLDLSGNCVGRIGFADDLDGLVRYLVPGLCIRDFLS
jgi:hypothetical protein